jgi:type I restriction enzyme M protein
MRRKVHYVIQPATPVEQHRQPGPHAERGAAAHAASGLQVHRDRILREHLPGLFSEINLNSQAGQDLHRAQRQALHHHPEDRRGAGEFSTDIDALGDAYEYLIGQFAAGSGKKAGEFYTPQQISDILSAIVTLDSQEPAPARRSGWTA